MLEVVVAHLSPLFANTLNDNNNIKPLRGWPYIPSLKEGALRLFPVNWTPNPIVTKLNRPGIVGDFNL
jgi:hypothetical protein